MTEEIGRYTVVEELRRGGMARTLLCRGPDQRLVVVKQPLEQDPALFSRLRDEFRVGRRVRHPHLVETLDIVEVVGVPALVLSYIRGVPLADLRTVAVPVAGIARIGAQVGSALHALHDARDDDGRSLGIVHRDLSAGNVLVTAAGDACLIDLGIARWDETRSAHTETGALIGTARYFAPELLGDGGYSPASDVWALACCLLELHLGRPLFAGRTPDILLGITRYAGPEAIEGFEASTPLGRVLARALARDPALRPTASGLAADLDDLERATGGGQADLAHLATRAIATSRARRANAPATRPSMASSSTAPSPSPSSTSTTVVTSPGPGPAGPRGIPAIAAGVGGAIVVSVIAVVGMWRSGDAPLEPAGVAPAAAVAPAPPPVAPPRPRPLLPVVPPPDLPPPDLLPPGDTLLPPRPPPVSPTSPPPSPLPAPSLELRARILATRELVMRSEPGVALRELDELARLAPNDPVIERGYVFAFERVGNVAAAREHAKRFIKLADPRHPEVPRLKARFNL